MTTVACRFFAAFLFRGCRGIGCQGLCCGAAVVFGEEAFEDFLAGGGADGVADTVVFGEGFDFDEIVAEVEVVPAVGVADGEVEFAVQAAQFEDALVTGFGEIPPRFALPPFAKWGKFAALIAVEWVLLPPLQKGGWGGFADLGDLGGGEVAGVKQVVDVGQAEPELAHEGAAVFVVVLAEVGQRRVGGLPETFGEGEGVEAFRWRVAQPGFQRAAVFARPDFMQGGLDDGVEVVAVGGEDVKGICENVVGRGGGEVQVFGCPRSDETVWE